MKAKVVKKKRKKEYDCFDCANLLYIGEGDHICDVSMELITDDWDITENYCHCGGKDFE